MKVQLERQIDNNECNGSRCVVSILLSLDVSFAEINDLPKPDSSNNIDDHEEKDDDEDQ